MKCKWKDCLHLARAKSPFCSGTCKKRYQRASGTDVPVEVGQEQVGQPSGTRPYMADVFDPLIKRTLQLLEEEAPAAALSDIDLQLRLKSYPGASWVGSPEHREVLSRRRQEVAV